MMMKQYGDPEAPMALIQMVDEHDLEGIESELAEIRRLTDQRFCLWAIQVTGWNHDLSPWPAPAVFGKEDFAGNAEETLHIIIDEILPCIIREDKMPKQKLIMADSLMDDISHFIEDNTEAEIIDEEREIR